VLWHGARLARRAILGAVLLSVLAPAGASAVVSCNNNGAPTLTVTMTDPDDQALVARSGADDLQVRNKFGTIIVCTGTAPHVSTTTLVDVSDSSGSDGTLTVDLSGGPLSTGGAEVKFQFNGGAGSNDRISLEGSEGPDDFTFGPVAGSKSGADFNGDGDVDVTGTAVERHSAHGNGGDDQLSGAGGPGFFGGLGLPSDVTLHGGEGNDTLTGFNDGDSLEGDGGNDHVNGGGGDDFITEDTGNDVADGGFGSGDTLVFIGSAGVRADIGAAGPQNTGTAGIDTYSGFENIDGSDGPDVLIGDQLDNHLFGNGGNDVLMGRGGADLMTGQTGTADVVSYALPPPGVTTGVNVDLTIGQPTAQDTGSAGLDTIGNDVEGVTGSPFADNLTGDVGPNVMDGLGGDDTLDAAEGADQLELRDGGHDTAACGSEADVVNADLAGVDTIGPDCEQTIFDLRPDTSILSGPAGLTGDATPTFALSSSEPNSAFECRVDGAAFAPCAQTTTVGPLGDGPHTFSAQTRDEFGNLDLTATSRSFTVDTSSPTVQSFSMERSTVLPASTAAKRRPRGTAFRYRLSEAAGVKIVIERRAKGRRVKGRCRKATRRNRKRKRCTRYLKATTLSFAGKAGANRNPFNGRAGRRKLRAGRYRASLTATDSLGHVSSVRRLSFRIIRAKARARS
jgi:Ca2+-binding RTX toxin-like protein